MLISAIGISNTLGRIAFGYLGDRIVQRRRLFCVPMSVLDLNNVCVLGAGLCVIATPFCRSYSLVLGCCIAFGLFAGESI